MSSKSDVGVLLVAHGTVTDLKQLPAFLSEIRRGQPAPPTMVAEMVRRYEAIGGSPLLEITRRQAKALSEALGIPALIGMRFGDQRIEEALSEAATQGLRRLVVLPLAPYSVALYAKEVERRAEMWRAATQGCDFEFIAVPDWGDNRLLIEAHAVAIEAVLARSPNPNMPLVVTAHSLPLKVIRAGDTYDSLVRASVAALAKRLGRELVLAYQSQTEEDGWLGPSLPRVLGSLAERGNREVLVSPIGFLSEHVETLYDLDRQGQDTARALGMSWYRVPAQNDSHALVNCMRNLVDSTARSAGISLSATLEG